MTSNRDERVTLCAENDCWTLAERIVDIEDLISSIANLHKPIDVRTTGGMKPACITCETDSMSYPWPCPTAALLGETDD